MKNKIKFGNIKNVVRQTHSDHFKVYRIHQDNESDLINPVLNIDHFFMSGPTFPIHPHAGFSAVTYMLEDSKNGFINRDSLGDEVEINPGDLHWTQAGTGVLHEESPKINGIDCHGLQIFINLPKEFRNTKPKVYHVKDNEASRALTKNDVAEVKVLTGSFENTQSKIQVDWATDFLQFKWVNDGQININLKPGESAFILNLSDNVKINDSDKLILSKYAGVSALNAEKETQELVIEAFKDSVIVVIKSLVINDQTVSYGPFVANNLQEMDLLVHRYKKGEFGTLLARK